MLPQTEDQTIKLYEPVETILTQTTTKEASNERDETETKNCFNKT